MIFAGLKIGLRHFRKFKTYSAIKIGGLSLGFAASIALLHFVSQEFSYDQFHKLGDNVYRVNTLRQTPTGMQAHAAAPAVLAPTLMADMPEVEAAVRLRHADDVLVTIGDKKFHETKVFFADSNFFKVLTFPLVKGDPATVLKDINTAVVTTEFAEKYFGGEDPINKTITVDNLLVEIRGVASVPGLSHFQFDMLIAFETFTPPKNTPANLASWAWTGFPTYVRLREGSGINTVLEKLPAFISKYHQFEDGQKVTYQLQPIRDVYLHSRSILERDGIANKGDYAYTIGLAAIALVIMVIACFNFANISAALSMYRVRETGVKRTLGSGSTEIFLQLITESVLNATVSLLLAIVVLQIGAFTLEEFLGVDLSVDLRSHVKWLPLYVVAVLTVGILGGLYPSLLLSRLKPQVALKTKNAFSDRRSPISFRKVVIVIQFFVTAALIALSLSIKRQIDFIRTKDLGYNQNGVVVLHVPDKELRTLYPTLRNKFSELPNVLGVSASRDLFDGQQANTDVEEIGASGNTHPMSLFRMYPNFIETMGIELIQGRSFTEPLRDSTSFVLNESAVKLLDWDLDNAVGKRLRAYSQTGEVIGVVKDFHFSSLHTAIGPLILLVPRSKVEYLYVRVGPADFIETLSNITSVWKTTAPHLPFSYVILDEHVGAMYRQDMRLFRITLLFCGLSVTLACLGLYSIISLMARTRSREIGIRKIHGATVAGITSLLSGRFMILVTVAAVVALPASYYLLDEWLNDFAYRINTPVDILLLSVLLSALLAGLAVCVRTISAARANPIEAIRHE